MMRLLLGGLLAVGLSFSALEAPALAQESEGEIVIGATVPLTGPLVFSGQQYHYSLQMAQDDINDAGGIDGRKVRIVFEDTQASNSVAVNAFLKLLREHDPAFIFLSSFTTQNLAVEPEVAKAEIPVMYAGGSVAVTDRQNPWMFRIRPDDGVQAAGLSQAVLTHFPDSKSVGIMYVQDDYGLGAANSVEKTLTEAGLEMVGKEAFGPRDNDFSAQLLSLQQKNVGLIVVIGYVRDTALILQQRRQLGIQVPVVSGQGTAMPATLDLIVPEDLDGVVATIDAVLGDTISPESADYVKRFEERFGIKADPFGSAYYDGAMIVAQAMREVGTDREKLRAYLADLKDVKGVSRVYNADEKGDLAHSVAIITFTPGTKDFALDTNVEHH